MAKLSKKGKPPGSFTVRSGRWYWLVKLPGYQKRKITKLCLPGAETSLKAMPDNANISTAYQLAWKIWEKASKKNNTVITDTLTVSNLNSKFLNYCDSYYNETQVGTKETENLAYGTRLLVAKYANLAAESITPKELAEIQVDLLADKRRLSITTINRRIDAIKRMYKWAVGQGLIEPIIEAAIARFPKIKRGRTTAKPAQKTQPANPVDVKATLKYLTPTVRDMVIVQWICSMRPTEIINMQPKYIIKSKNNEPWLYWPEEHKNKNKGKYRVIAIFPDAQKIIEARIKKLNPDDYIFSPAQSAIEARNQKCKKRKTPLNCGNRPGSNVKAEPKIKPGDKFSKNAYPRAVKRAIQTANKEIKKNNIARADEGLEPLQLISHWSPRQLRHAKATENRALAGQAIAAILLGHTKGSKATNAYTHMAFLDDERAKAAREVREAAKQIMELEEKLKSEK